MARTSSPAPASSLGGPGPIVARIRAADREVLRELREEFGGLVHAAAHRVTGDELAAELITAGVFVHLWWHPDELTVDPLGAQQAPDSGSVARALELLAHRRAILWLHEQTNSRTGRRPARYLSVVPTAP